MYLWRRTAFDGRSGTPIDSAREMFESVTRWSDSQKGIDTDGNFSHVNWNPVFSTGIDDTERTKKQ